MTNQEIVRKILDVAPELEGGALYPPSGEGRPYRRIELIDECWAAFQKVYPCIAKTFQQVHAKQSERYEAFSKGWDAGRAAKGAE